LPIVGALVLGIIYSTIPTSNCLDAGVTTTMSLQPDNDQNAVDRPWIVAGWAAGGIIIIIAILYAATNNNKKEILLESNKQATLRTTILNRQSS
jgi:hypothetical protein